jgi:hypothetical protein
VYNRWYRGSQNGNPGYIEISEEVPPMRSLRTISVTCWPSLLVTGLVLAASYYDLHDWPAKSLAQWWAALLLWAIPFVVILELARRRRPETLALALGFGVTGVGVVGWEWRMFRTDIQYAHSLGMFLLGLPVTAVFQGIMSLSALWIWWKSRPLRPEPRFHPVLVFFSGLLAGVLLPPLVLSMGPRRATDWGWPSQPTAHGAMRLINTAEVTYASTYDRGFSPSLAALAPGNGPSAQPTASAAGLIDSELATGVKKGYRFTYTPCAPDADGKIQSYTLTASPLQQGGGNYYYTDQTGVIRQNSTAPASANDPPIAG